MGRGHLMGLNGKPCGKGGCTAHRRDGSLCTKQAIDGGSVCYFHGGEAPQTKAKAQERLNALVMPMIATLARYGTGKKADENPAVAARIAQDVLDRCGIGENQGPRHSAPTGFPMPAPGTSVTVTSVKMERLADGELDTLEALLLKIGVIVPAVPALPEPSE